MPMMTIMMEAQTKLAIARVENGWLIRTQDDFRMDHTLAMRIAKTPDELADEIRQWAQKQESAT
jgi:alkanesulfonate monooxygenase SsuD/methylene tetrahydromethanopterin reductase-like flavin-dependent oxidoreductase (luciferase family)